MFYYILYKSNLSHIFNNHFAIFYLILFFIINREILKNFKNKHI